MQTIKKYQNFLILFAFFLFLFIFSIHIPLNLGDDYMYQFLFDQKVIYKPLAEDAIRITSWADVFYALKQHYLYWHGRLTNHFLFLSMLYIGKPYFDFITACMSIVLFILIYWYSQKGEVTLQFNTKWLLLILGVFWLFTNHWATVFFWIGGATNYLYTSVFILILLLPYLRLYYHKPIPIKEKYLNVFMILFGLVVGCTNENSIPAILLLVGVILLKNFKTYPVWAKLGFCSMLIGFLIFLTAPSTKLRILEELYEHKAFIEHSLSSYDLYTQQDLADTLVAIERVKNNIPFGWLSWNTFYNNCIALFFATNMYIFLFLYIVCGMFLLQKETKEQNLNTKEIEKDLFFIKILLFFTFVSLFSLIVSPLIVLRSVFFALVSLTICILIMVRLLDQYHIEMFTKPFKRFGIALCSCYIVYSVFVSSFLCWKGWQQYCEFIDFVKANPNTNIVVELPYHFLYYKGMNDSHYPRFFVSNIYKGKPLAYDTHRWMFVSFARYYQLKDFEIMYSDTDKFLMYCK